MSAIILRVEPDGNDDCRLVIMFPIYGSVSENRRPTIKPTQAAMATAFLRFYAISELCRFTSSTWSRLCFNLVINEKSEGSSGL